MMGTGIGAFGLLLMVLFWVGLIALAVWLVRVLSTRNDQSSRLADKQNLNTHQILDRRCARREITREQHELMRQDLG